MLITLLCRPHVNQAKERTQKLLRSLLANHAKDLEAGLESPC